MTQPSYPPPPPPVERARKKMLTAAIIAVIVFAATFAPMRYFYTELESAYTALKEEHEALTTNYELLEDNYTETQQEYVELSINYTQLEENYQTLMENYKQLQLLHQQLNITHYDLKREHEQLETAYQELNIAYQHLMDGHGDLESDYEALLAIYQTLNATYNSYEAAYSKLAFLTWLHVWHPWENETLLITPEDPAVKNKVEEITGGWSDPTDWTEYWTEVKMMYDWVVDNIEYRSDGLYPVLPEDPRDWKDMWHRKEMWQFPNQTLDLGKGDCDDMAILLCSMIYYYGNMEYWVECIVITEHCALYIPVAEDEICILDPSGRYYTGYPSKITSKDISDEVHYWLDDWWGDDIENPIVEWIFSASIWKEFDDTELFISWLYER